MRSPNMKYIPELDQLRGLAALLVLYFHAIASATVVQHYLGATTSGVPMVSNVAELIVANGFQGVALFFVISGFLFTWGALRTEVLDWKQFYTNRALRILPMYLLLILVTVSVGRGQIPITHIFETAIGLGNLNPPHNDFDIVLWTISIEIQFYLLFPALIMLLKRKGVRYLFGLIAVLVLMRFLVWADHSGIHDPVYWTLLGRLDQFLIGMIAAWGIARLGWMRSDKPEGESTSWWIWAIALSVSTAMLIASFWIYTSLGWKYSDSWLQIVWSPVEAMLWAFFGICYTAIVRRWHPHYVRPIQFIGMISYSLYLLHYPIVKALNQSGLLISIPEHMFMAGLISTTLQVLPVAILASLLTYYVVERPPLQLRRQYATFQHSYTDDRKHDAPIVSGSDS